jgi:hypothetical protein
VGNVGSGNLTEYYSVWCKICGGVYREVLILNVYVFVVSVCWNYTVELILNITEFCCDGL